MSSPALDEFVIGRGERHMRTTPGSTAEAAIDVDSFDTPPAPLPRPHLPRAPREPIVIDDDEDDEDDMDDGLGGLLFAAPRRRRVAAPLPRRHRLFSPPPPPPAAQGPLPPVPGIPERLRRLASVNFNLNELLFRVGPLPPGRGPGDNPQLPVPQPRLGLGGFILRQAQHLYRTAHAHVDADGWEQYDPLMFDAIGDEAQRVAVPSAPQYKREWLFPRPLPPGYTSNFDLTIEPDPVIDLTGKGKKRAVPEVERMIVCANCGAALVASAPDAARRVWALRCGHVVDGCCLSALSVDSERAAAFTVEPDPEPAPAPPKRGRGRATRPPRGRKRATQPPHKPVVETLVLAEHEWACPVRACGRKHYSQFVRRGTTSVPEWIQKPDSGAIQMFT